MVAAMSETPTRDMEPDIVIAGGGLNGMTLALALAQAGLRPLVIDGLDPATTTAPAFDGRVSAIAASSVRLFKAIGLWEHVADQAQPILDILVSDGRPGERPSALTLHFDHRALGPDPAANAMEPLGHLIENRHIRLGLQAAIARRPEIAVIAPARITGLIRDRARAEVATSDGRVFSAPLAVSAEGRQSTLRQAAGIKTIGWDYDQTAIVTAVEHEAPHEGLAHELFLPSGPFAILPMVGNRSSIVWTERTRTASHYLSLGPQDFDRELARRFGGHWGRVSSFGPRWSYPLSLHLARRYVDRRLALIGDAAHGIHPIAGQGLNLGLRDVACLAETLVEAWRCGLDLGDLTVLERYEAWRRTDNVVLAAATDGLVRLFSNDWAPARLARDLGIGMVQRIGPLRRFFMRHAMGDVGQKPRLLDGLAL